MQGTAYHPLHIFGPFQNRGLALDDGCLVYLERPHEYARWAPCITIPDMALDELARIGGLPGLHGIASGQVAVIPSFRQRRPIRGVAPGGTAA